MTSLYRLLAEAAGDATAFLGPEGAISFGRIRAAANALDLTVGDVPAHIHTRSAALFCAGYLAAARAGRPIILLPQASEAYLREIGAAAETVLSDDAAAGLKLSLPGESADAFTPQEAEVRLWFSTSGSSGVPKSVFKPASAVEAEARAWSGWIAGRYDRVAATVSHQHVYGLIFRVFTPLLAGLASTDEHALSWEALWTQVDGRTLIASSPAHLTRLPAPDALGDARPGCVISSGGPLSYEAVEATRALFGVTPVEVLGSTETGGVAMRQRFAADDAWTPLSGVAADIDPDDGRLCVRSAFTGEGGNPVVMGDQANFLPDGRFTLGGRADRVVKVEGKRVSLPRVEAALTALPGVEDAAVLMTSQNGRDRLSALVALSTEARRDLAEQGAFGFSRRMRSALAPGLEPAERPKRWRFVPSIPVNAQSKRVVRDLAELFDSPRYLGLLKPHSVEIASDSARIAFTLDGDLPFFQGHFHSQPVLPGVAQAHLAVRIMEEVWSAAPASFSLSRLKFQNIIKPGDTVELRLAHDVDTRRLTFSFTGPKGVSASGVIG